MPRQAAEKSKARIAPTKIEGTPGNLTTNVTDFNVRANLLAALNEAISTYRKQTNDINLYRVEVLSDAYAKISR